MEDNKNEDVLDIIICTHKDFNSIVSNKCYKTIDVNTIDYKELGLKYDDDFYCELLTYMWIIKNWEIKEYIGFCHYRRYFSFIDNIPNMEEIFKNFDAILPTPLHLKCSVKEHYAYCHNIDDLEIIENIVKEYFPDYYQAVEKAFNGNMLFTNNMFIMKKDDFFEFMNFYTNVINMYLDLIGNDIDKRINDNKSKYLKNYNNDPQASEIWYQKRIGGFMAERLLTVFVIKKFNKIKLYDIKLTEKKYKSDRL